MPAEMDELEKQPTERDGEEIDDEIESEGEEEGTTNADNRESDTQNTETSNATLTKSLASTNLPARVPQVKSARDAEPYDFDRCTVLVMLQLMPLREGQSPHTRKVFVSARTHSHPPYVTQAHWSELEARLPDEIKILLARVKEKLPQLEEERRAAEETERQRQAQIQADLEKRRAAKKEKANATKSSALKRGKKIDLNAPPTLPAGDANNEDQPQVTVETVTPIQSVPATSSTPFAPVPEPQVQAPTPQMTLF